MLETIDPKCFMINCKFIGKGLSYEDYLIEILNWSNFFKSKAGLYSEYRQPESEAHGESDAISDNYEIDFKILINQDVMNGMIKNKPTVDKRYIDQGIIMVNDNPNPTPIPKRNVMYDIMDITSYEIEQESFKNDTAKNFIKNLEKDKNLFLYYPYEFRGDEIYNVNAFAKLFTQFFRIPLEHRTKKRPDKETYLCIKINENFLIFEWFEDHFIYRDTVIEYLCSAYRDYKMFSFF